jgi:hypothetical protein
MEYCLITYYSLPYLLEQVELNEGPLDQFSHDMEPFLRKQGLPVRLNRGN